MQSWSSSSSVVKHPAVSGSQHVVDDGIVLVQEVAESAEAQLVVEEIVVVEEPEHTQSMGCRHSSASADLEGIDLAARIEADRTLLVIRLDSEVVDLHSKDRPHANLVDFQCTHHRDTGIRSYAPCVVDSLA